MGILDFRWWKDDNNRGAVTAILGSLKIVVPALLVVAALFGFQIFQPSRTSDPEPAIRTGDNSLVQTGSGNMVVAGDNATVTIGLTFEQHKAELQERLSRREAQLKEAHGEVRDRLLSEIAALDGKLANAESDYAATVEELRQLRQELESIARDAPAEKLDAALSALSEGDRALADNLLAEVEERSADAIRTAARAAFARGEIAEQEIRWADAARHYARAARLDPTFDSLIKAREFAWRAGDLAEAFRLGEDLIAVAKDNGTQEDLSLALNEHALTVWSQGHYGASEQLFRQALEIDGSIFGEAHPHYAIGLSNLAAMMKEQGRYAETEPLFRQALAILRATIGEAHPDYAISLNNLAAVLEDQGRYAEAEPLYRQALEITRASIGDTHPAYAIGLSNLAGLVVSQGRSDEAEGLYRKALDITRATIGEEHPDYGVHLVNLGSLLGKGGRVDEAREMLQQALAIFRDTLPADHPHIATVQTHLDALPAP